MAASVGRSALSVGIYSALNVAGLTALVSTRIYNDVPQAPTFPFVWYELFDERNIGGLGDGTALSACDLRVHIYSTYAGTAEADAIGETVVDLLKHATLTATGHSVWFVPHAGSLLFRDELINGVKCKELVEQFRVFVETA